MTTQVMSVILITHDLGVVAETCRRAVVMYCGRIIESAPIGQLFAAPRHPYTAGLLNSIPKIREHKLAELPIIPGRVPDLLHLPAGCRFADRCTRVEPDCRTSDVALNRGRKDDSAVACLYPLEAGHG